MLRSILLAGLFSLGVSRSVVTQSTTYKNGSYYFSDLGNSNYYQDVISDGDNLYHTFVLQSAIDNDGYNFSEDTLSAPISDDFTTFDNLILYSWSNNDFVVSYDNSFNSYSPSVSFDVNSRYLYANFINYDNDNNKAWQILLNSSDYFVSFELYSSTQYVYVMYDFYYSSTISNLDSFNSYNGFMRIDTTSNNVVNIPYLNSANLLPNFTDYFVTCKITLIMPSLTGFNQGYSDGYNNGYNEGYQNGNSNGYDTGYNSGYNVGFNNGANSSTSFTRLLFALADTPIYYLKSLFSVELFGIKVYAVILSMITTMVIIWVVRKFVL